MKDKLSHIPPNDTDLPVRRSIDALLAESGGVERAPPELLASMNRKRSLTFVESGSDMEYYMNHMGVEARVNSSDFNDITLRRNPSKAAVLEEYLHGVQSQIGVMDRLGYDYAEWHVRDFMIRHQTLVGLGDEDIARLDAGRQFEAHKPEVREAIELETARKQEARAVLQRELAGAEHHAARGVGAASLAVNIAEGNVTGAAMDAAGMLADNTAVQKTAMETAAKLGVAELAETAAKKIPVVGAVVTVGTVLYASGAQALDGNYKLAAGELVAGVPEIAGNIVGFGVGDAARETARQGLIAAGGDEFAAVEKSGLRQLGEAGYTLATGQPVGEVLPPSHASMAQGADDMGERSQVSRIAIERAGTAQGHMIVLEDGSVQAGTVPFGNNPQIAAGKNSGTLGILYTGTEAMNDAQWQTVGQVKDWLGQQRQSEGFGGSVEMIAGSTGTAELLKLPTPRGPLPAAGTQPNPSPMQNRPRALGNGM